MRTRVSLPLAAFVISYAARSATSPLALSATTSSASKEDKRCQRSSSQCNDTTSGSRLEAVKSLSRLRGQKRRSSMLASVTCSRNRARTHSVREAWSGHVLSATVGATSSMRAIISSASLPSNTDTASRNSAALMANNAGALAICSGGSERCQACQTFRTQVPRALVAPLAGNGNSVRKCPPWMAASATSANPPTPSIMQAPWLAPVLDGGQRMSGVTSDGVRARHPTNAANASANALVRRITAL